jgi:hypothetical protein
MFETFDYLLDQMASDIKAMSWEASMVLHELERLRRKMEVYKRDPSRLDRELLIPAKE